MNDNELNRALETEVMGFSADNPYAKPFDPLHDHNHLMMCVEKMLMEGFYWSVNTNRSLGYFVFFVKYDDAGITTHDGECNDKSYSRAQAIAMLQAVGVEV